MDRLRFLASAALLLSAFLWTNCAEAAPPTLFPECECPSCTCTDCSCLRAVCDGPATCECVGCAVNKTVNQAPVRLVLFTAEEWCAPCQTLAPHWQAVSENDPICETIDLSEHEGQVADHPLAKEYGVSNVPTLVRLIHGKPDKVSQLGAIDSLEAMQDVVRRWKSEVMATFAEGVRETRTVRRVK